MNRGSISLHYPNERSGSTLYAGASKFVRSEIINLLISDGEQSKTVFIITQWPEKIARGISHILGRGSTQMQGQGM